MMTYLPETLPTIERLGLAFDEMDLELPPTPMEDEAFTTPTTCLRPPHLGGG